MACHLKARREKRSILLPLGGCYVFLFALVLFLAPRMGVAQGDPNIASLSVDIQVAQLYRITGIQDVTFSTFSGDGDLTANRSVCVWTNSASGSYRVTAHGDGTDSVFTVAKQGDATKTIPYSVSWITVDGTVALTKQQSSATRTGANTVSSTCASGPSAPASFVVTVDDEAILQRPAGTYIGILTLSISPPT